MIPFDFHYAWPSGAYLILLSLLSLLFFWLLYRFRQRIPFTNRILITRSSKLFWIKAALFSMALALCILALMQPVGNGHYPEETFTSSPSSNQKTHELELKRKAHDIIFLIDASASMGINDTRLQKTRLDYAKDIADELIASLTGQTIALNTFTSQVSLLSPLSLDYLFTRLSLKEIQINEGGIPGTNIERALTDIRQRYFTPMPPTLKLKTLILLSDGGDTTLESMNVEQRKERIQTISNILQEAIQHNLRIYTIGLGSTAGGLVPNVTENGKKVESHLNSEILKVIALYGRGHYYEANQYTPPQLTKELLDDLAKDPPYYEKTDHEIENALLQKLFANSAIQYDRYYQIPLALALLCLAFILYFPDQLRSMFLLVICLSPSLISAEKESYGTIEMLKAKSFVEAKMFAEARSIYEKLLYSMTEPYPQAALRYNIGTTYLEEHLWDQAIAQFVLLFLSTSQWPLLHQHLSKNLALAHYENGLLSFHEQTDRALNEFKTGLLVNSTLPPSRQEPLNKLLKQNIARLQIEIEQERLKTETLDSNLLQIMSHLNETQEELSLISTQDQTLQNNYALLFANEQTSWTPLWTEILKITKDQEISSSLKQAHENFTQMNYALKRGEFPQAIQSIEKAKENLIKAIELLSHNSYESLLLQLLNEYQRLLSHHHWKDTHWKKLEPHYQRLGAMSLPLESKPFIQKSQQRLDEAIKTSKSNHPLVTRYLLTDAAQWIRLSLILAPHKSSYDLLEAIIQQQHHAFELTTLALKQTIDSTTKTLLNVDKESQKAIAHLSELFYARVYQEQIINFSEQGLCQATPWATAFPLFNTGEQNASLANQLLQQNTSLPLVAILQSQALDTWQKTLSEIRHPSSQNPSCFGGNNPTNDPSATSLESITSLLQMELEDRKPPIQVPLDTHIQKPW